MKPIIGIIARPSISDGGNNIFYIHTAVKNAVIKYGGIPIVITPTDTKEYDYQSCDLEKTNQSDMIKIINKCNGLIFQGGDNFYDYDLSSLSYAYTNNIPTLGICLGMQTMGYLFNGEIDDLPNDKHLVKNAPYVHSVILNINSKLYKILKNDKFNVNSRHKSYVKRTDLLVSAHSNDNIIEAIEDSNKKFFIGIEWHPENMIIYEELASKLFKHFINICKGN